MVGVLSGHDVGQYVLNLCEMFQQGSRSLCLNKSLQNAHMSTYMSQYFAVTPNESINSFQIEMISSKVAFRAVQLLSADAGSLWSRDSWRLPNESPKSRSSRPSAKVHSSKASHARLTIPSSTKI